MSATGCSIKVLEMIGGDPPLPAVELHAVGAAANGLVVAIDKILIAGRVAVKKQTPPIAGDIISNGGPHFDQGAV